MSIDRSREQRARRRAGRLGYSLERPNARRTDDDPYDWGVQHGWYVYGQRGHVTIDRMTGEWVVYRLGLPRFGLSIDEVEQLLDATEAGQAVREVDDAQANRVVDQNARIEADARA